MRHLVKKKRFGRHTSHRQAMFRNMVTSLIEHERITTTVVKAKELRRIAEKMVTLAKKGSLHARRQAARYVRTPKALKKLFADIGPRFTGRNGGYTRVLKLGFRHGDGADMALIEYVDFQPKSLGTGAVTAKKAPAPKPAPAKKATKKPEKAAKAKKETAAPGKKKKSAD